MGRQTGEQMATEKKHVDVGGIDVLVSEDPGKPLMLLVRMAARGMGIWDGIWERLAEEFTVAQFDLPAPQLDKTEDPVAIFRGYAEICIQVAAGLGHERFHIFGWTGGTHVAIRCAIEHPERLLSCVLLGPVSTLPENRPVEIGLDVQRCLLDKGLREYTNSWLLSGLSWDYALNHFDAIQEIIDRRMEADRGRMDTERVFKWVRALRMPSYTDAELDTIRVPTLIVAPGFDRWPSLEMARRLYGKVKSSELAVMPGAGALVLLESPEKFMAVAGRFLRAAARGNLPSVAAVAGEEITVFDQGQRLAVVEPRGSEAVVFLHGWLMSPEIWRSAMDALHRDVRCIAPWQPAHGPTMAPPAGFTMDAWADWTVRTLTAMGVERALFVGHSMGGFLAQNIAIRHPDMVAGLCLVGIQDTVWPRQRNEDFILRVESIAGEWSAETAQVTGARLMSENYISEQAVWFGNWKKQVAGYDLTGMTRLAEAIAGRPDFSARTSETKQPVLVVHGAADQAIAKADSQAMTDRFPNAQFTEISGAGHCPPLEQPQAFAECLSAFLADADPFGQKSAS